MFSILIVNVNVTKYVLQKFVAIRCVLSSSKYSKTHFGRGSAPDPAGESYDTPQAPSWLGRGTPLPTPFLPRRLQCLDPGYACG